MLNIKKLGKVLLFMLLFSAVGWAQSAVIDVSIPEMQSKVGDTLLIPIEVSHITQEDNVTSYNFAVSYDENIIDIFDLKEDGTITPIGKSLGNFTQSGKVNIGMATTQPIAGTGALIYLKARIVGSGISDLSFDHFLFNNGDPSASTTNGKVSVGAIDVTIPDLTAAVDDTVLIPVNVSAISESDAIFSYNMTVSYDASVINIFAVQEQGTVTPVGSVIANTSQSGKVIVGMSTTSPISGEGALIYLKAKCLTKGNSDLTFDEFYFNSGEPAVTKSNGKIVVGAIKVEVSDDLEFNVNTTDQIPVIVTEIKESDGVYAYNFTLSYDADKLTITGVSTEGTITPVGSVIANTGQSGKVIVGMSTTSPISGEGVLLYLDTEFKTAGSSILKWDDFYFNSGVPPVNTDDGMVTIIRNTAPTFTAFVKDTTISENQQIILVYTASDADGDPLTYSAVSLPEGSVFDNESATFTWTPTYEQADVYDIIVSVTDNMITVTDTTHITVSDVNRAPAFVDVMPDTTINEGQALNFTYTATDADADVLAYSLVDAPEGAAIDGSSGAFTWTPTYEQAGTYDIVAVVSDGALTDTSSTAIVIVSDVNRAPAFVDVMPDTTINEGQALSYTYTATDADGDVLAYSLVDAPEGAAIDGSSGAFTWNPTYEQAGTYDIVAVVSDGALTDTSSTAIVIRDYAPGADLFFSEYIEGSSNNKALELFNGSDAAVNLDDYRIAQSVNGGGWQYYHYFPQGATLDTGDVWVILNEGTSSDYYLAADADEVLPYPSVVHHNGDDARGIEKRFIYGTDTTWVLIDVIGIPDEDPGYGWDVAGVTEATKNHTLIRKSTVTMGNIDWAASAGTDEATSEWVVMPENTFAFLGSHPHDDFVAPEIAGVVAVSTTELQVRFTEDVAAVDVANFVVGSAAPTAVEMPKADVAILTIAAIEANTPYTVSVTGVKDLAGLAIVDTTADFKLVDMGETLPIDYAVCEWESAIGTWWAPTGSGSTSGILEASSFAMSDEAAYVGSKSAKLDLKDDPAKEGGWFVRLCNRTDKIAPDSKLYLYMKGTATDVQARFNIWDNGAGGDGYEVSKWYDVTIKEDDWQVICLDLANDPVTGWITGNGAINSTDKVTIESIQLRCGKDIDAVLYFDLLTERKNIAPVEVTFEVDMSVQTILGNFNIASDIVDIAGNFNDWGGDVMVMDDADGDTVYSITVTDFYPGESLEYKFRINSNWDTSEFPGGGPNRVYVVPAENSVVRHWYDDKDRSYLGIEDAYAIPKAFALHQNYPNPFNPMTTIKYELPKESFVRIAIYDLMGHKVCDLVNQNQNAGYQTAIWNATDNYGRKVSSGYYIYIMDTEGFHKTQKMILLK